jgi:hypothetical protein
VFGTTGFWDWARESGSVVCVGRRVRHCVQVRVGGRSEQGRDTTVGVVASNRRRISYPRYGVMQVWRELHGIKYLITSPSSISAIRTATLKSERFQGKAEVPHSRFLGCCYAITDLRWDGFEGGLEIACSYTSSSFIDKNGE